MKTFEFNKKCKQIIIAQFNAKYHTKIDDVLALSTIERHWINDKVFVFKLYETYQNFHQNNTVFALYYRNKNDINILEFYSENEAYKFILK